RPVPGCCRYLAARMKLIILDRDGVINEDSDAFVKSVAEWHPLPGSIEAIARLSKAGWTVAVATNQSGLARGYFTAQTLEAMHQRLRELVAAQGGHVDLIRHCPHGPDDRSEERRVGKACSRCAWLKTSYKTSWKTSRQ